MGRFFARKLARLFIKAADYFYSAQAEPAASHAVRIEQIKLPAYLQRLATQDAADYIYKNLEHASLFATREDLWAFALSKVKLPGNALEFGVSDGYSINYLARLGAGMHFYGFDSFEGLEEDWSGTGLRRGFFSREGKLPDVPDNVTLIKGWFDQTLPAFLNTHKSTFPLIHIDCDTHHAAATALALLADRLSAGTIIIFDEYINYAGWRYGEWKAWQECAKRNNISYRYLAFSLHQALICVT